MRRDMDLIRDILLTVADAPEAVDATTFTSATHPPELILYHAKLIDQAGLAEVTYLKAHGGIIGASIGPLTWQGCDFIDTVRSETLWKNLKTKIATSLGTVSFNVLTQTATRFALDALT